MEVLVQGARSKAEETLVVVVAAAVVVAAVVDAVADAVVDAVVVVVAFILLVTYFFGLWSAGSGSGAGAGASSGASASASCFQHRMRGSPVHRCFSSLSCLFSHFLFSLFFLPLFS